MHRQKIHSGKQQQKIFDCLKEPEALAKIQAKYLFIMKNIIYSLVFMLSSTFSFANENITNKMVNKEITAFVLDGKSYSPEEFSKLNLLELKEVKECTITITSRITINGVSKDVSITEKFEASWWGCLFAKIGALIVSMLAADIK